MCVCVCVCVRSCVSACVRARVCGVVCLGMCVHARAKNLSARLRSSPPLLRTDLRHCPLVYKQNKNITSMQSIIIVLTYFIEWCESIIFVHIYTDMKPDILQFPVLIICLFIFHLFVE